MASASPQIFAALGLGLLCCGGCALSRPAPAIGARTSGDIQCTTEHVTGSVIPVQVCTAKAQREARQASGQDFRDSMERRRYGACAGGPMDGSCR
ncbi:MAG: hypothetical protein JO341_08015 [Gammaproteobacteria bacterium]|nr:hypothetical protein [Gammaproteobacteria bacterium]MBV9620955.1 hypothetical protein [Gammaproteobacteria bacterium]